MQPKVQRLCTNHTAWRTLPKNNALFVTYCLLSKERRIGATISKLCKEHRPCTLAHFIELQYQAVAQLNTKQRCSSLVERTKLSYILAFSYSGYFLEQSVAGSPNVPPSILGNFCPRPDGKPEAGIQLTLHRPNLHSAQKCITLTKYKSKVKVKCAKYDIMKVKGLSNQD